MKKTYYILMAITAFMALFASACGAPAPATQQAAPPPVVQPTQPAPPPVEQPTQSVPATQAFAPACPAAAACAAPAFADVAAINTYCVQKIPYQNISIPKGITYEVVDSSEPIKLKCSDTGTLDNAGVPVVTCTGKQLWKYELKLTNTACAGNLATGTGQCQDGLGYDAAQNCCAPVNTTDAYTQRIQVNIGACP
jgi:hypothetical protein